MLIRIAFMYEIVNRLSENMHGHLFPSPSPLSLKLQVPKTKKVP